MSENDSNIRVFGAYSTQQGIAENPISFYGFGFHKSRIFRAKMKHQAKLLPIVKHEDVMEALSPYSQEILADKSLLSPEVFIKNRRSELNHPAM